MDQLWDNVLLEIEMNLSKANFNTWFKDTFISKIEDGTAVLCVPNSFVKEWLSAKYHSLILKSIREKRGDVRALEYFISKDRKKEKDSLIENSNTEPVASLNLEDYSVNSEDNLNPKYSFDSFVIGPFNELAHAASQAIIQKPGIVYNPLFIYGQTGHGKTHLIQAVGNEIKKIYKQKKVFYVTSEKFAQEFVTALRNNQIGSFKDKYRNFDVLIMDDIQFLSKKDKTQEELFHIFNSMYDTNRQIIFSSDQHPNYISDIEDRLKSRFAAGMTIDIPTPDHESRYAILKTKALHHSIDIEHDILDHLAGAVVGNIRELEGALNSVICQTQLKNRVLTLQEVKQLIKNTSKPKKIMSVKEVIKIVSEFYNIDEMSIYEKTRRKDIIKPRQIIMYLLRKDFNISYPAIGQKIGGRDHTTVIHSCDKIEKEVRDNPTLEQELNRIRSILV